MRRDLEEMSFDTPPGWQERMILSYVAPPAFGEETPPSVVVVREPLAPGDSLLDFVQRHLAELDITPRESGFVEIDGMPAYHVTYEFQSEREALERTTCFFEMRIRARSVVTHISTICAKSDIRIHRATFEAVMASVRLDRSSGVTNESTRPPLPSSPPPMSSEIRWNAPALPDIPMPGSRARR
jgi:hypothetical protein